MTPLIHLIYASTATRDLPAGELVELLATSRRNNRRADVTGMLLHTSCSFFQVLEGPVDAVERLFERIGEDRRHANVVQIIRERIAGRSFPAWTMGYQRKSSLELATAAGFNDFFESGHCLQELGTGRARRLLKAFGEGRWRTSVDGQVDVRGPMSAQARVLR